MEITPVAFDSMGVRSMATFVKTKDVSIFIDPAVSLAPSRYGLPPHEIEVERMNEKWKEIKGFVEKSDVVVITHYHYDHHNPNEIEIFDGKKLLVKHPKEKINRSQMKRAAFFLDQLKSVDVEIDYCDGKSYEFGNVSVVISEPVYHGANDRLGYVVEVYVESGDGFLFSSDVEGPIHDHQLEFMLEKGANIVFIDGPMTYMLGYRFSQKSLESSVENLIRIIEKTNVEKLVLDHHLTRDLRWRERMKPVFDKGEEAGVAVLSAAEFAGVSEDLLEARRDQLYGKKKREKKIGKG